jgi:hypothetical protein
MSATPSWASYIQGLTTFLTGNVSALTQRNVLKVVGTPVFDDGTETVLGGIQTLAGSGTWDGKSSIISVGGSGARLIALPEPDSTLLYNGLQILVIDFAGNANAGNITIDPAGSGTIANGATVASTLVLNTNNSLAYLLWRSAGNWMRV